MGAPPPRTVADIMNAKLLYLREGDRLTLARGKILEMGVTAVPILDDQHRPVGVVSLRDLMRADGATAEASPTVHSVLATASIQEGARALAALDVHHLVVVDAGGIAVGMVSAVDFVRALAGVDARHPPMFDRY